jgi:hypothetical protein
MSKKSTTETLLMGKKLFEEGYNSLSNFNNAMQVMENVDVTEESVSKALAMMIRTHAKLQGSADGQTWNVENFVKAALKKVLFFKKMLLSIISLTTCL